MSEPQQQPIPQGSEPAGGVSTSGPVGDTGEAPAEPTRRYVPRPSPGYDDVSYSREEEVGTTALAVTMIAAAFMLVSGIFSFFEGLAGIIRGGFFVVLPNYAFSLSAVGWGWLHLIMGVILVAVGAALLLADRLWARIAGVVIAACSMVLNFVYLPYYPVWSIVLIALDAFVIWALLAPRHVHT
jgi:hypothetical protein